MLNWEPTAAEIEAACREIQSEWSPAEERKRRGIKSKPVAPMVVRDHSGGKLQPSGQSARIDRKQKKRVKSSR